MRDHFPILSISNKLRRPAKGLAPISFGCGKTSGSLSQVLESRQTGKVLPVLDLTDYPVYRDLH